MQEYFRSVQLILFPTYNQEDERGPLTPKIIIDGLCHQDIGWAFFMALNKLKEMYIEPYRTCKFVHFGNADNVFEVI